MRCAGFDHIIVVRRRRTIRSGNCRTCGHHRSGTLYREAGDEIQTLKSGIMEIAADVFGSQQSRSRRHAETFANNLRNWLRIRASGWVGSPGR